MVAGGHHLVVPFASGRLEILHPHAVIVDARGSEFNVVGVVDESAIGTDFFNHIPERVDNRLVDKGFRVVD